MIEPSRELRDTCAIVGTGHSRLGRVPGVSSLDLLVEAMRNAIADAGIDVKEIDGIVCRGPDDIYSHHQQIGARLGINVKFSTSLDNGGASQILAVAIATMAINAGLASTVICGYGRDSWSRTHSSEEVRVKNQTTPDDQLPKEFAPEYGFFGAPGIARAWCDAPHASLRHHPRPVRRHRGGVPRARAAQPRRPDEEAAHQSAISRGATESWRRSGSTIAACAATGQGP